MLTSVNCRRGWIISLLGVVFINGGVIWWSWRIRTGSFWWRWVQWGTPGAGGWLCWAGGFQSVPKPITITSLCVSPVTIVVFTYIVVLNQIITSLIPHQPLLHIFTPLTFAHLSLSLAMSFTQIQTTPVTHFPSYILLNPGLIAPSTMWF